MSKDKVHFFTRESYSNPNSEMVWYHSGCHLIAAGAPTENISKVTCERCKSYLTKNHPRYQHHNYAGNLELYFETGMECMGTIFHADTGLGAPNPLDNGKPFHSLAHTIWFGNRMCLYTIRIFDKDNNIVYEGSLKKDRQAMARNKYAYAFLPQEISASVWLDWCRQEYRAELYTNELTSALKEQHQVKFEVGEVAEDTLSGKDVVITNVMLLTNDAEYWVNDDVRDGNRKASELRKLDFNHWQARERAKMVTDKVKIE